MSNLPQRGSLTEVLTQLLCIERHRSTHGGYCANCLSVVENRWLPQLPHASTSLARELGHDGVWDLLNKMNEHGEVPEASGWDADGRPIWLWLNEHGGDEVYMYAARLEIEDGAVTSKAVEIDPDEDMRYPVTILASTSAALLTERGDRHGEHSGEDVAGRALAKRLTSDDMIQRVARAVADAQVHGRVEYTRRAGYRARLSIAQTVLDAICEGMEIPTSLDLLMDPDPRPTSGEMEADQDDDCDHDWTLRPESDTRVCEFCGAER